MATPKTILLKGCPLQKEAVAAGAITPGDVVALGSAGTLTANTSETAKRIAVAMENSLVGDGIGDDYASGDQVIYAVPKTGDELYMWLSDGNNAAIGDYVTFSSTAGELELLSADDVADYTITWSANEPTAGDSQTIADGDSPTVAETGQAIADITAKINAMLPGAAQGKAVGVVLEAVNASGSAERVKVEIL